MKYRKSWNLSRKTPTAIICSWKQEKAWKLQKVSNSTDMIKQKN